MNQQAAEVFNAALDLNEADRIELATRLFDSIDPLFESEVEQAWNVEIERRLEEIRTGEVKPIPWSEARQLILEDTDESDAG